MEVAHTSMIHAADPHFPWPFAVRYAAHQLNLWPRVSFPETSPTLCWTGKVGDASVFRVWGSRAFVRDTSADKLSSRAFPYVFLGFTPNAPGWQFYHPTLRCVFPSQDATFDESVPFYRLFPYRSAPPPPPLLFLAPGPPPAAIDSGAARSAAPGGAASGGAEPGGEESEGAKTGGAERGVVETGDAEPGGAEPEVVEPRGAESEGADSGGAEPQGAALSGGSAGASPRLSPQQLREWFVRSACIRSGATGAGCAGAAGPGGAAFAVGAGVTGGNAATGPGVAHTRGTGAAGIGGIEGAGARDPTESGATGAGGSGAGGAGAGGARVGGTGAGGGRAGGARAVAPGGAVRLRPYFVPLLQQVLGTPSSTGLTPPLLCPPPDQSLPPLQPASPRPAPSPYTEQSGGLTERRELASRPLSPVCTARRVPRSRPPPVPGMHAMTLRPSSVPLRVPLPAPPASSLPEVPDLESDRARAASPTVSRLLATAVTDPSFESAAASALVVKLLDFAAACRLDYSIDLVAKSASASPPSVGDPDAPNIPTLRSYAEAITGPYSSQWQAAMDAEMASSKSTGTYVDEVPPPGANIVDGMEIFKVKRPPGSPPAFKAHYVARGFRQRQGVDYFQTFSPTPKMTTLRMLLHVAAQRDFELHSLDFSTAFAPHEWHDTLRTTLAALGFAPSTVDPSLFLRNDTSLPPLYVHVYVDDLVFATADTEALTLVKSCSCEAEIYAGAMAAQELCWLTYLLTDLGEQPRSPPDLYVDNKAMVALCHEHRPKHKMKHIALRYFLARELQQRGQLHLPYVATRANTADVFTKALPPGDHQRFSTVLGLVPTLPHMLTA
ncbi:unnamed protein product [Closterium sp. NIES-54]